MYRTATWFQIEVKQSSVYNIYYHLDYFLVIEKTRESSAKTIFVKHYFYHNHNKLDRLFCSQQHFYLIASFCFVLMCLFTQYFVSYQRVNYKPAPTNESTANQQLNSDPLKYANSEIIYFQYPCFFCW